LVLLGGLFVLPAAADIYKWTDERGSVNFSNVEPPKSAKARNVQVIATETKTAPVPEHTATPTEQALLDRIKLLERQVQAQAAAPRAVAPVPALAPAPTYYPPPMQPPPQQAYSDSYDNAYYPGYDTAYAPAYYYPVPAYTYAAYPRRYFVGRPGFVGGGFHGGGSHGGGGHGARR
jgi:hypothetical protein